ncbi:MAG: Alpha-L-glutamate ligase, RimK family [Candidatus Woesebacteria bacterium GW2011_GWA1_33_30]|uniref:Alpha-L-glutamate ligase, RimK family n=1 Tax=Candidatus Woesebacteria bacterium GW2011_GWA2_33_28 TaxID=1618561 RepID=A0A0G0A9C5_9BACT|nr:MAG: Alpha-L-glutamate ligase, RimK family [Candidatus Woesebacteria bacterium GW2011_GWA2_33_28]KKP48729.1 MAG: Alpha-L-glutamate ligase, RimK family [Candidatus Woesebacteria bacterium GW2011_GWA1_33_30]KKP50002.1 MAG: Alpha-L-glutamate ligase, RimK family [Microgenomates group bacterium GW2011_GWC1_33_32]KKP51773.1 MAG: Alpha-L-glutamate ligase, RimK family [Candidatus Woesebacteria bacterium GW2011_GWB1_33_38]KKP58613.1 MAG: Alpha-L-glutamate ligase, RimK family [Microgenomates group bac
MKKILVLVDRLSLSKKKLTRFLNKNSSNLYQADLRSFSDLFFEIKTGKVKIKARGVDLSKYDLVFVRRAGKYVRYMGAISKYLDFKKVKFIDPAFREIGMSMDKASSAIRLAIKKIPMPDSYFCFRSSVVKNKEKIILSLGLPIIAKAINSQRNKNIFILKSSLDFDKLLKRSKKEFIFQKFIDIESEYRLLVMGGKVVVLEQKSVRNYKKIKVEYLDPDEPSVFLKLDTVCQEINKIAIKSTSILNLDIAGVDIAIEKGTNKNFLIEVNKGPGIVPDAKTSPELKAFSDYLKSVLK